MFYKLLLINVTGKFYRVIKHMYFHTTTSVKLPNGITNSIKTNLGIRQGDGLIPLLFCLYINDIANMFDDSCAPFGIGTGKLSHLLYADDLMLLSETKTCLQMCINKLKEYCNKWKLTVNLKKTKVIIFKVNDRKHNAQFMLRNENLEVIDSYKYLGITISSSGSFSQGINELAQKGRKAWFSLRSGIDIYFLTIPNLYINCMIV